MKIIITERQKRLLEKITETSVICDNCGWSWELSDGENDPYICHKCGHDNEERE
jgi:tRNA(Ile2) C34 agmatinyltransferase TiaS